MTTSPEPRAGFWRGLIEDPRHGPLPALLLVMTVTTGVVDAVSILSLGRVFVANMTGNVVFVGFALVGAKGFSLAASLFALGGFLLGARFGGEVIRRKHPDRAVLTRNGLGVELALFALACLIAALGQVPLSADDADAIAALLAIALGLQNAVVRRLAVPDLTTTVLTMTLTGIAADDAAQHPDARGRRLLAVLTMFGGAVGGALLVLHVSPPAALGLAVFLTAGVFLAALLAARTALSWRS